MQQTQWVQFERHTNKTSANFHTLISIPRDKHKVVSKIFWTGAAIYTAVVVARSTGPNRPNCKFQVLLRRFAATAWKGAKTSPRTLVRTDLAASLWQRSVSHFRPHPAVSGERQNGCYPPPTLLPWFGTLSLLPISKYEIEAQRTPVWYHCGDAGRIAESAWHSESKGLTGSAPKMEETVGPVSTCGRELLWGWWWPTVLMASFMIFTESVQNILDTPS
jgi:hypothetical protein